MYIIMMAYITRIILVFVVLQKWLCLTEVKREVALMQLGQDIVVWCDGVWY